MKKIKINKGWFRSAGNTYKWMEDGYNCLGVGIAKNHFLGDEKYLKISVSDVNYTLGVQDAKEFATKYKSFYKAGKTDLVVVSKSLLIADE